MSSQFNKEKNTTDHVLLFYIRNTLLTFNKNGEMVSDDARYTDSIPIQKRAVPKIIFNDFGGQLLLLFHSFFTNHFDFLLFNFLFVWEFGFLFFYISHHN